MDIHELDDRKVDERLARAMGFTVASDFVNGERLWCLFAPDDTVRFSGHRTEAGAWSGVPSPTSDPAAALAVRRWFFQQFPEGEIRFKRALGLPDIPLVCVVFKKAPKDYAIMVASEEWHHQCGAHKYAQEPELSAEMRAILAAVEAERGEE